MTQKHSLPQTMRHLWVAHTFLFLTLTPSLYAAPSLQTLAKSQQWKRLLHYSRLFPYITPRSRADGAGFFFSPPGANDPEAEMAATIEAFSQNIKIGRRAQHPQCAFPARYQFLKKNLALQTTDVPCPEFDDFIKSFHAQSATLVFSSAYANNPASLFGHTFLRINSKSKNKLDMLDRGISYAAAVGDENGFVFAFNGLTGGYTGLFSVLPYYNKVNEYSNAESRDIWEYDLSLNEAETNFLLSHLWEIETNTYFDYFFFDENCSTILLALLEVAKPQWNLSAFPLYAIPGETVKKVASIEGAVTAVKYRPSLRKKMHYRFQNLENQNKKDFFKILSLELPVAQVESAPLVEAVTSYLAYEKQEKQAKFSDSHKTLLEESLIRRSELGGVTNTNEVPPQNSRPDFAHNPFRLGTSAGVQKGLYFQELQFKFMAHDLLNNDSGYIPFSQIEFSGFSLRLRPADQKLIIESIDGLNIKSLFPLTFLEKRPSWTFNFRYQTAHDLQDCSDCHVFHGEIGAGATAELFTENAIAYAMVLVDADAGDSLRKGFRFGPRLQTAALFKPFERYKLQLTGNLATDLLQSDRQKVYYLFEWNQAFSINRWWDVRTSLLQYLRGESFKSIYNEAKFTLNFFF